MEKKYYAGIGARDIPEKYYNLFIKLGMFLAKNRFILRSGAAQGSDKAFETGCVLANGGKEIFLPWEGFESSNSNLIVENEQAFKIAEQYHPYYNNLKLGAKKLQARNSHQVLGWDLKTPSSFIICYTKDGKGIGGTGQAIRIAKGHHIPVFDCGVYENIDECRKHLWCFLKPYLVNN